MLCIGKSVKVSGIPQCTTDRSRQRRTKKAQSTPESIANGFLNHCFEAVVTNEKELRNQTKIETEFFQSLAYLSDAYSLGLDVVGMEYTSVYPHNVYLAIEEATKVLSKKDNDVTFCVIEDDTHNATVAVFQQYELPYTAYLIPVKYLYEAIKESKKPDAVALLCAIVSYLVTGIGIPFFSDQSSYAYYQCKLLTEYFQEQEDDCGKKQDEIERELAVHKALVADAEGKGTVLYRYIQRQTHLASFEIRYQAFQPVSRWEQSLHKLAGKFLYLKNKYPTRHFSDSTTSALTDEEDYESSIDLDQRVSFVWDEDDSLTDNLGEVINSDIQGGLYLIEPLAFHLFDAPGGEPTFDFEFDTALYRGLGDLYNVLMELDNE